MKPNIVYRIVHFVARAFFRLYGRWQIIDLHKLPKTGPVIVTPNHVSYLDPPLVGAALPRECASMGRHDLFQKKWMAWLFPRIGAFPVERGRPDRAAIRKSLDVLSHGLVLVIFPEGGRSDDGTLQPAEAGVALIVQKSGAPVVPVAVIGPEKMLPVGKSRLKRCRLKVVFGDPLFFTPDSPREEVLGAIMGGIARLLAEHGAPTCPNSE